MGVRDHYYILVMMLGSSIETSNPTRGSLCRDIRKV